ncbi:hypothetical protein, partial [Amycolatopsis solani]
MNEPTGDVPTFGVEEEFFVVDRHGHLSQAGDDVGGPAPRRPP